MSLSPTTSGETTYNPKELYQTMYMKTVDKPKIYRSPPTEKRSPNRPFTSLNVDDIEGAKASTTKEWGFKRVGSESKRGTRENYDSILNISDIPGTRPSKLIPERVNKPNERNLKNDDIVESQPLRNQMKTTRCLNPLNPVYQMPKVEWKPPTPPKFIRDNINVDDIEGTKASTSFYLDCTKGAHLRDRKTRDTQLTRYADIVEKSKSKVFQKKSEHPIILEDRGKSNRIGHNPLSPRYVYDVPPPYILATLKKPNEKTDTPFNCNNNKLNGSSAIRDCKSASVNGEASLGGIDNKKWTIGDMGGTNHPSKLPGLRKDRPLFSLRTEDIEYMKHLQSDFVGSSRYYKRRHFRNLNNIEDIEGTKPCSGYSTFHLRETKRKTNPLNPDYKLLG